MITVLGDTSPVIEYYVREIERAYFSDIDITVTISNRQTRNRAGTFFQRQYKIMVYKNNFNLWGDDYHVSAVIAHELGHAYQYRTDRQAFDRLTSYGLELYAD